MVNNKGKYTLDERIARCRKLHEEGYNCSQCVTMVFDDIIDIPTDSIARISSGFGGGLGGLTLVCGAVTGMTILEGMCHWHTPADKQYVYGHVRNLAKQFEKNNGSLICSELKSVIRKPCMQLIEDAVTLMHRNISNTE